MTRLILLSDRTDTMGYSYDRRTASDPTPPSLENPPTYKGKALKPAGKDVWVLQNHAIEITAHFGGKGWKATLKWTNGRASLPSAGTYGRDIEAVINDMIKMEQSRIAGEKHHLAEAEKALHSL